MQFHNFALNNIINICVNNIILDNNLMGKKNLFKNSACICLGLLFISLSSFLMTQIYFQSQIDAQIQNISLLKDIRYPIWGKSPNPTRSIYTQTFTLYELKEIDNQIHSDLSNISKPYEYHYQYQNTSFAQGNSGRLNFINKWQLKQPSTIAPSSGNIKSINLAADKIFNYDHYAPAQRKFVLFYNYMLNVIAGPFLEKFYTLYLHKFFFQQKQLVLETVFKPLGIDASKASAIYQHQSFGWSDPKTFISWVKLSLKGEKYSVQTLQYEQFMTGLNLTQKQISGLVFEKSTLSNMIFALNGTIKSKLMQTKGFSYKKCKEYCSNLELAGFQIATGFLTGGDPLFASLGLNISTKDLNSTFFDNIQYSKFCNDNKGKIECTSESNMAQFFTEHYLGDFELMDILWNNQDNTALIEQKFHLQEGKGKSIVAYVMNLYEKFVKSYESQFSWAQNNYNNIENSVMAYKNLFLVELFSRAFYNKYIKNKEPKCEDYFVGQFNSYQNAACQIQQAQSQSWNFIHYESVLRNYLKAYFFIDQQRNRMADHLSMPYDQIIQFFQNSEKSLFAQQIDEIEQIFKQNFACIDNDLSLCSYEKLFCLQWGSNKIFQNLPVEIFSNKIKSINEWDTHNVLNGYNPDYFASVGQQKTAQQCMSILSSDSSDGIFSLFNIMKMSKQAKGNPQIQNRLKYVGKSVMQIYFGGVLQSYDINKLFEGFTSDIIKLKQNMQISNGGAPWMENKIKLIKMDNAAEIKNNELELIPQFDTIDTGIFNKNKTREISRVWGQSTSSSKYTVFHGTKTDDDGQQVPFDIFYKYVTDRKIEGTNLLGFHPFIEQNEKLNGYILQAYQAMGLKFDQEVKFASSQLNEPITANKYELQNENMDSFIGIEQLNQNYFSLSSDSYAIIEPTTGLTLELKLIYTMKSNPLYSKFITQSSGNPINVYSSEIYFKRSGLIEIEQLKDNQNDKRLFTLISIVSIIVSLVLTIVFTALYCTLGKKDRMKQTLLESEVQTGQV